MIPPDVVYLKPGSVETASSYLRDRPGAVAVAGGTMVLPALGRREQFTPALVDLCALGLDTVTERDGALVIGALASYSTVASDDRIAATAPLLRTLAAGITGGAQIRNQGTLGGSACRAAPASDVPAALSALGATMRVHGPEGPRDIAIDDFWIGAGRTALAEGELLTEIVVSPDPASAQGYVKFKLCESSWPIVTAAALVTASGSATVAVGGFGARPVRVEVEVDPSATGTELPSAAELRDLVLGRTAEVWSDELAGSDYRQAIVGVIARRALRAALDKTEGKKP